jgi:hypothetical protein
MVEAGMSWWDHAVMIRLHLGHWAPPRSLRHYEQEAEDIAEADLRNALACQPGRAGPKKGE